MEQANINEHINLLTAVKGLIEKYDEVARIKGDNFNVFQILKLTQYEVRTHSAFLAELLNPNGSHGLGDTFLRIFIQEVDYLEFKTDNVSVQVEKRVGKIDNDYTIGGNIDIIISNSENAIIIENKIYAGDQKNQLLRYQNYAMSQKYKSYKLYYLTLDGKEYISQENSPIVNYTSISYKQNIINWLQQCIKETYAQPIIRETLNQYINLIKHLTHQTMSNEMSNQIIELILKTNSFKAAKEIANNAHKIESYAMNKFKNYIINLERDCNCAIEFKEGDKGLGTNDSAIIFKRIGYKYYVQFFFEEDDFKSQVGITNSDDKWVQSRFTKDSEWFDEFNNSSWTDVYTGHPALMEAIKNKVNILFEEIEKMQEDSN